MWYTVVIDDGDDFEDFDTIEEANKRCKELREQGYECEVGVTD